MKTMYRLLWGPNRQTVRGAHSLGAEGAAFSHDECKKAPSLAAVGQRMRATLWGAPRCFFGSCGPSVRSPVPPGVGSPFSVAPPPRCPIAHVSRLPILCDAFYTSRPRAPLGVRAHPWDVLKRFLSIKRESQLRTERFRPPFIHLPLVVTSWDSITVGTTPKPVPSAVSPAPGRACVRFHEVFKVCHRLFSAR